MSPTPWAVPGPSPAWHQQHQSGPSRGGFHPNWAEVAPKQPRQEQRSRRRPRGLAAGSPPEATSGLATGKGHSAPWNAAPGSGKSCSGSGEGTGTGNCCARNAGTPRRAREEPGDVPSSGDSSALRPRLPLRLLWPRDSAGHRARGHRAAASASRAFSARREQQGWENWERDGRFVPVLAEGNTWGAQRPDPEFHRDCARELPDSLNKQEKPARGRCPGPDPKIPDALKLLRRSALGSRQSRR